MPYKKAKKKTCLRCGKSFTILKSHLQRKNICERKKRLKKVHVTILSKHVTHLLLYVGILLHFNINKFMEKR